MRILRAPPANAIFSCAAFMRFDSSTSRGPLRQIASQSPLRRAPPANHRAASRCRCWRRDGRSPARPDLALRKVVRAGSLAFVGCHVELAAGGEGTKAIDIGIHSVGTKPSGSTMPCFAALASACACRRPQSHRWPCWPRRAGCRRRSRPAPPAPRQSSFGPAAACRSSPSRQTARRRYSTAATASRLASAT